MKKIYIQTISFSFLVVFMFSILSCDPARSYERHERTKIQDYLSQNSSLNFVLQPSGLYYLETVTGTGATPVLGDSAFVLYKASFLDGSVFDSTSVTTGPYAYIVGESISGFDEGIMLMKAGGKAKLLVPSSLAYGPTGNYYGIPGYTPILFDVNLIRVKPHSVK